MTKRDWLFVLLTSIGLVLSFPPFITGFCALVALVPLFMLLNNRTYRQAFWLGYLVGFILTVATLYWVTLPTVAGGVALMIFLPAYFAVFTVAYSFFHRQWGDRALWLVPFLWTGWEWVRSLGELAFPWLSLGYTQSYYIPLIQFAAFTGVYGVSFWIVLVNVLLYFLINSRHKTKTALRYALAMGLTILAPLWYGYHVLPKEKPAADITVALLQGNVDPFIKWDRAYAESSFAIYHRLAGQTARQHPQLVIWPETAAPCYLKHNMIYRPLVHGLTDSLAIPMLIGAPDYLYHGDQKEVIYFNSAFLFHPGSQTIESYNKIHLVPFSERLPFIKYFPVLKKVDIGNADFSYGTEYNTFTVPQGKFAVLICFESIFPELVRALANQGCDFLVNITNDGWFGRTAGPYQHAQMAVFRAIENRISIARCANTGVSMVVDPYGRTGQRTAIFLEAGLVAAVPRKGPRSFFSRYGDIFSRMCAGFSLCALVAGLAGGFKK
jgi:apolipoprotein N-acyltransferase